LLISFSGVDGSGKSTQIESLVSLVEASGFTVRRLAFWDDVVVLTRYREGFVHRVYGSEQGVGSPERPVRRRDKNVRRWYLTLARHALYLLDAIHLRWVIARHRRAGDVIVMDRYIYDELANLPLVNRVSRVFARMLARVAPQPDLAYLLDADPVAARARKPEYPLEFMHECRGWYLRLAEILGIMTVIAPGSIEEAREQVSEALHSVLGAHTGRTFSTAKRCPSHSRG
jgi:thymidylate kinase